MALHNFPRHAFHPPPEPMLINWRRGLFCVWLLVSAGWVMGWTIYLIMYGLQDTAATSNYSPHCGVVTRV